ncbi:phosphotransferase family protein [Nonomuraea sp. NPDC003560]|uniref:phosphotransferase family protein n=1 Tax=Nonomuraea sp. NPDC003560 TaxID=3364341 RepID=UPI00368F9D53
MNRVETIVREVYGPDAAVPYAIRLPGGASRETWALDVVVPGGDRHELVLRLDGPGAALEAGTGLAEEARLMQAAAVAGVPVPHVVAAAGVPVPHVVAAAGPPAGPPTGPPTDSHTGRPPGSPARPLAEPSARPPTQPPAGPYVLMSRIPGETIPRRILRDEAYREARPKLAAQCGRALAAIHRMPLSCLPETGPATEPEPATAPKTAPLESAPAGTATGTGTATATAPATAPQAVPADPLRFWRGVLDLTGQPHPVFELALRRLEADRPPAVPASVVHGDFRNGNLIVGPEGVRAVLDWELAHAGDPLEDLGWLCVKAWRFGSPLPVGGFGGYAELIAAYEEAGGRPVDLDALRWWETFGVLKWGIICVMQTMRHLRGGASSVELAALGRRACQNEWDLLGLLT